MKADPRGVIQAHYATLVDARTDKLRFADHAALEGIPAAAATASFILEIKVSPEVSAGLVTVMGLLSAFFFGVMLQIAERALDWADTEPAQGPKTSRHALFLGEIQANAGYASFTSILTAAVFVATGLVHGTAAEVLSGIGIGLAVHVVLLLFMVSVRVFKLTQERLLEARAGARLSAAPRRGAAAARERSRHS